jgi:uncharacterized RDD family membrane protein YckC
MVRLIAAFLDWLLAGILAAAIGDLFGVQAPAPPSADGGINIQLGGTGPFILVELAYFTYFHTTTAGQSIGNKILGIRVLDADTGRSLPYARAFVRALMSNLSALALFLGYFWMLWEPRKRTWHDIVANSLSSGPPSTHPASSAAPHTNQPLGESGPSAKWGLVSLAIVGWVGLIPPCCQDSPDPVTRTSEPPFNRSCN